ncbi:MAG TPA: thiamine phosphate synthase [Actinocrinis sp.]|nr:thiamine phosphate synthase [Actinocrinis sp.]
MGAAAADLLASARLYLCTDARERQGDLAGFLDAVLGAGVDIVQLRQKGMEARAELAALEVFADACARHGKLFAVNDRADLASAGSAPVLHLGQDDLPVAAGRRIVGPEVLIGRSTHGPEQVDAALAELRAHRPGYFCVGPCWPTPTKPGRAAPGLGLVGYAARQAPPAAGSGAPPWFAIGGIDQATVGEVLAAGARRIVVVRAITEAADPAAATRELVRLLGPADPAA